MKKSIQFLTNSNSNDNSSSKMFDSFLKEQKFINENLCPLNCVAQYVWFGGFAQAPIFDSLFDKSSGKTSFQCSALDKIQMSQTAVPSAYSTQNINSSVKQIQKIRWSKEVINTRPQSIELCKDDDFDSSTVALTQQGIYQLDFVLFIPEESLNPTILIKLDEHQVLSTIDSPQPILFSSDSQKQIHISCFIKADKLIQQLSIHIQPGHRKPPKQQESSRSNSQSRQSSSASVFSPSIQARKQNIMNPQQKLASPYSNLSEYAYIPQETRGIMVIKKL